MRGACGGDAFAGELSALGDGACRVRKAVPATFVAPSVATTQTAVFTVVNMTCAECTFSLAQALRQTPGVSDARVDFTSKRIVRIRRQGGRAGNPEDDRASRLSGDTGRFRGPVEGRPLLSLAD